MTDEQSPGIGHNRPPAYDPQKISDLSTEIAEFTNRGERWAGIEAVESEAQAGMATDYLEAVTQLEKRVEETRKAEKQPHLDAGREVDAAYGPLKNALSRSKAQVKAKLAPWLSAQQKAAAEAAAVERARIEAEKEAAARQAADAMSRGDMLGQSEAEAAMIAADKAEKKVERQSTRARAESATGVARARTLHVTHVARVANFALACKTLSGNAELWEALETIANKQARGKEIELPGFTFERKEDVR